MLGAPVTWDITPEGQVVCRWCRRPIHMCGIGTPRRGESCRGRLEYWRRATA